MISAYRSLYSSYVDCLIITLSCHWIKSHGEKCRSVESNCLPYEPYYLVASSEEALKVT